MNAALQSAFSIAVTVRFAYQIQADNEMNGKQKIVIALAAVALVIAALLQPGSEKISAFNQTLLVVSHFSYSRLFMTWAIVIVVFGILFFAVGKKDGG